DPRDLPSRVHCRGSARNFSMMREGTMSQETDVFEKLMASEEAKRAYANDPIFRYVMDEVRARLADGADPLVTIGQTLASLSESKRKDAHREIGRRLGATRPALKPWWS